MVLTKNKAYERAEFFRHGRLQTIESDISCNVNMAIENGKYRTLIVLPEDLTIKEINRLLEPYKENGYYTDKLGHTIIISWEY